MASAPSEMAGDQWNRGEVVTVSSNVGGESAGRIEGLEVEEGTQEHGFVYHGHGRSIAFWVIPEESNGERGWEVRIEGIPGPSIVHERPWASVEEARDAAARAASEILWLDRKQQDEMERNKP